MSYRVSILSFAFPSCIVAAPSPCIWLTHLYLPLFNAEIVLQGYSSGFSLPVLTPWWSHGFENHVYTEDTQICIFRIIFKFAKTSLNSRLIISNCLFNISMWVSNWHLKFGMCNIWLLIISPKYVIPVVCSILRHDNSILQVAWGKKDFLNGKHLRVILTPFFSSPHIHKSYPFYLQNTSNWIALHPLHYHLAPAIIYCHDYCNHLWTCFPLTFLLYTVPRGSFENITEISTTQNSPVALHLTQEKGRFFSVIYEVLKIFSLSTISLPSFFCLLSVSCSGLLLGAQIFEAWLFFKPFAHNALLPDTGMAPFLISFRICSVPFFPTSLTT